MGGKQYCQYIAKHFISGEPRLARAPAGPREGELLQCGHTGWRHDHHHYHLITCDTRPYRAFGQVLPRVDRRALIQFEWVQDKT